MKNIVLSALAVAALAGSAMGQAFNLEVQLVGQTYSDNFDGTLTGTTVASGVTVNSAGGDALSRTVRIEGRYRLVAVGSSTGGFGAGSSLVQSAGLSSASMNLGVSNGGSSLLRAAPIAPATAFPYPNPQTIDTTSDTGLYSPFRTGVFQDTPLGTGLGGSNGTISSTGLDNVLAISASSPDHRSTTNANARQWGLFAFDLVIPAGAPIGQFVFTVGQNGANIPLYFRRTGAVTENAARNIEGSFIGSSFTVNVVPAPASAALLGLGGLVVARRRR